MTSFFRELQQADAAEDRCVSAAEIRRMLGNPTSHTWARWRKLLGIARQHKITMLSALGLLVLARFKEQGRQIQCVGVVIEELRELCYFNEALIREWLTNFCSIQGPNLARAIERVNPSAKVRHRQYLYRWCRRAGFRYSTRKSYSPEQVRRVAAIAA